MNVKVKICGIRTIEQAEEAVAAGADFLGLNFVPTSKRVIDLKIAKEISKIVKGQAILVGVFQNQSLEEVNAISEELGLDFAQLHGDEDEIYCNSVSIPVIKAFGLESNFDAIEISQNLERYNIPYYLIDREKRGTGEMLSLENAADLAGAYPLFFSGALHHENVAEVIKMVKPFAVDVASGIETENNIDIEKMKLFIKTAKEVII